MSQWTIRGVPPELEEQVREEARRTGQSLNQAVISLLSRSAPAHDLVPRRGEPFDREAFMERRRARQRQADELPRGPHDHTCHATVRFAGDPRSSWWIDITFAEARELDELVRLLLDLRNNPQRQREHIHLQDHRLCDQSRERHQPGDVEIVFRAPGVGTPEFEREFIVDGSRALAELQASKALKARKGKAGRTPRRPSP